MSGLLTREEYEIRKTFLGDLKQLGKSEKGDIFRILKKSGTSYSENSNGIFFDVLSLDRETLAKMIEHVTFCKSKQNEQNQRLQEMEVFRGDLGSEMEA